MAKIQVPYYSTVVGIPMRARTPREFRVADTLELDVPDVRSEDLPVVVRVRVKAGEGGHSLPRHDEEIVIRKTDAGLVASSDARHVSGDWTLDALALLGNTGRFTPSPLSGMPVGALRPGMVRREDLPRFPRGTISDDAQEIEEKIRERVADRLVRVDGNLHAADVFVWVADSMFGGSVSIRPLSTVGYRDMAFRADRLQDALAYASSLGTVRADADRIELDLPGDVADFAFDQDAFAIKAVRDTVSDILSGPAAGALAGESVDTFTAFAALRDSRTTDWKEYSGLATAFVESIAELPHSSLLSYCRDRLRAIAGIPALSDEPEASPAP